MIRCRLLLITLLCVGLLISACQFDAPAATSSTTGPAPTTAAAGTSGDKPPTPGKDTGVIFGTLLRTGTNEPFPEGIDLYLAEVLKSQDQAERYAGLDRTKAPRATPDRSGKFFFSNVKPGRYALAAVTPVNQVLVPDQKQPDQVVLVTVEAARSVDLGTLRMDLKY